MLMTQKELIMIERFLTLIKDFLAKYPKTVFRSSLLPRENFLIKFSFPSPPSPPPSPPFRNGNVFSEQLESAEKTFHAKLVF
jgi:hypothetical protein